MCSVISILFPGMFLFKKLNYLIDMNQVLLATIQMRLLCEVFVAWSNYLTATVKPAPTIMSSIQHNYAPTIRTTDTLC